MLRYDKCVYWPPNPGGLTSDDFGKPINANLVELQCRWENDEEEFIDREGRHQVAHTRVYLPSDAGVVTGGILWHGPISAIDIRNINPYEYDGAWEIRHVKSIPKLKNNEVLFWALF